MNAKRFIMYMVLAVVAVMTFYSLSFAVPIWEGYDEEAMFLTYEGTTSWEDDLEAMEEQEIQKLLNRIRAGDQNVMSYIVYQTYERLHFTVYAISLTYLERQANAAGIDYRERFKNKFNDRYRDEDADLFVKRTEARYAQLLGQNYYQILGYRNSLPAFVGGFNNQDPKVRLKVIGYLGDWVDDIGLDLDYIKNAVERRLHSGLETRIEVKYALEILRLKILRKQLLKRIYLGDTTVLKNIDARDFVVLVRDEDFIRKAIGIPPTVQIRSIRLDPYVKRSDDKKQAVDRKNVADKLWRLDSYDFTYENDRAFKAIFAGLENDSLFVRENCLRVILEIVCIADSMQDPVTNKNIANGITWIDDTGATVDDVTTTDLIRIKTGILADLAKQAYYINLAKKLWDNVVFSTFSYASAGVVYTGMENFYTGVGNQDGSTDSEVTIVGNINNKTEDQIYADLIAANTINEGDGIEQSRGLIGHLNYRIMVADLLRSMGLKWYLGEEEQRQRVSAEVITDSYLHLFNRQTDKANYNEYDRHDWIEGEVPQTANP